MVEDNRADIIMAEPPTKEELKTVAAPSGSAKDITVFFVPSSGNRTRGIEENLQLSLVDFSEKVAQAMGRFGEKYNWEVEIDGEVKIFGVFTGAAKLKISPKKTVS